MPEIRIAFNTRDQAAVVTIRGDPQRCPLDSCVRESKVQRPAETVGLVQKRIVLGARNLDEALLRRNQGIEVLPREESRRDPVIAANDGNIGNFQLRRTPRAALNSGAPAGRCSTDSTTVGSAIHLQGPR